MNVGYGYYILDRQFIPDRIVERVISTTVERASAHPHAILREAPHDPVLRRRDTTLDRERTPPLDEELGDHAVVADAGLLGVQEVVDGVEGDEAVLGELTLVEVVGAPVDGQEALPGR